MTRAASTAWRSCSQPATAAKRQGHHAVTFEAAAALAETFGKRKLVNEASDLRYVRNNAEYRAEEVGAADVTDAIAIGDDLTTDLQQPIESLVRR